MFDSRRQYAKPDQRRGSPATLPEMNRPVGRRRPSWRIGKQLLCVKRKAGVRLMAEKPALCRYTTDGWRTHFERRLHQQSRSVHDIHLHFGHLHSGDTLEFRFRWSDHKEWDERVFQIELED